ncbi:hypothetical protein S245_045025, partial [Arachis hypogaea]
AHPITGNYFPTLFFNNTVTENYFPTLFFNNTVTELVLNLEVAPRSMVDQQRMMDL